MNNKVKGIIFIIFVVVILSSGILIAYNYYTESPNKGTNFDQCTEDCDEDKNGNSTSSKTSTSTTITTTEEDNDNSYVTTRRTTRTTTTLRTTTTTRRTTTVVTTTVPITEPEDTRVLLETGDITKPDTNGSVMYYFYDNGDLVIDGTGDAIMKDFTCGENIFECTSLTLTININMFWDAVQEKAPSFVLDDLITNNIEIYYGMTEMYVLNKLKTTQDIIEYLITQGMTEEEAESAIYDGLSAIFTGDKPTVFEKYNTLEATLIDNLIINNNINTIGSGAFIANNVNVITIPKSIEYIRSGAFSNSKTTQVEFEEIENSLLTSIGSGSFATNQLTSITIPSNVVAIGNAAFAENSFTAVTILSKEGRPETRFNSDWETIGFPLEFMPH